MIKYKRPSKGKSKMKEYDIVEVIVEKEQYAKQGVHKGMHGMIYDLTTVDDCFEVYFSSDTSVTIARLDLKQVN